MRRRVKESRKERGEVGRNDEGGGMGRRSLWMPREASLTAGGSDEIGDDEGDDEGGNGRGGAKDGHGHADTCSGCCRRTEGKGAWVHDEGRQKTACAAALPQITSS